MENASKALIIAGAVLIAIMILAIGIYLINTLKEASDSYVTRLDATELQKYNSSFEVFVGRTDVVAQEIITLINITQQKEKGTQIYLIAKKKEENITNYDESQKNKFLEDHILTYNIDANGNEQEINSFEFISIEYDADGKVSEIKFSQKN